MKRGNHIVMTVLVAGFVAMGASGTLSAATTAPVSGDVAVSTPAAGTIYLARSYSANPKFHGQQFKREKMEKADVARFESRTRKGESSGSMMPMHKQHWRHVKGH